MKKLYIIICFFIIQGANAQTLLNGIPQPNGELYAIEKVDSIVYIGGQYWQVNGQPRAALASYNIITGQLTRNWNPSIDNSQIVTSITRVADKLIVGGSFDSVDSIWKHGICMFDLTTGNLNPWSDTAFYYSWKFGVGVYNNTFYYARSIDNYSLGTIVCVDALTGNFTPWQSDHNFYNGNSINAIFASGSYVYVGGIFNLVGASAIYDNLCRFSQSTGALDTSWHPQPSQGNFGITSIVETNNNIFVGGDFDTISGQIRPGVAAFDLNGNLTGFNPNCSSFEVQSLFADGNYIWVGGNSWLLGGESRYRIAQIRINNSIATCWDASPTSSINWDEVSSIYVSGDTVYAGPDGTPRLSVFINSPLPQAPDTITGPTSVINYQVATYTVPFNAGHTYNWYITGGSGSSTSNSINVTWGTDSIGTVAVVENNSLYSNCYGDTATLMVSISPTCIASFNSSLTNICEGNCISFTNQSLNAKSYLWTFTGGNPPSSTDTNPPNVCYNTAGNFVVKLVATGNAGIDSATMNITVNSPLIALIAAGGSTTFCAGDSVTLNANTGSGLSYQWLLNATIITGDTLASINALAEGKYQCVVSNICGSDTSNSITVTVNPLEPATSSSNSPLCSGSILNLTSSGGISYSWTGPNSFSSNLQNSSILNATINDSGSYTVTVTDSNGCYVLLTTSIAVIHLPIVDSVADQIVCNGASTSAVIFSGTASVYSWTNSNTSIGLPTNGTGNISAFTAINNDTAEITATITATPISPKQGFAYIPNYYDNTVSVIDIITNTVVSTIKVWVNPLGVSVSPDGSRVYITNNGASFTDAVYVINTSTDSVIARITLTYGSCPIGIVVSPDGSKVYVCDGCYGRVSVINTSDYTTAANIAGIGQNPWGIAVSPDGSEVFVGDFGDNTVSIINTSTNSITATIPVPGTPWGITVSPDGKLIYVNNGSNSISVINVVTDSIITTIMGLNSPTGSCINAADSTLYVANAGAGTVSVINTATNSITKTISVGNGPVGVSLNSDGTRLYVANSGSNSVSVINTGTDSVISTITVGSSPRAFGNFVTGMDSNNCTGTPITFNITVYPDPIASFTLYPDTTQLHHYIAVNNSSGISTLSYNWSWGDGTYDTAAYPTHIYADSGFYTICLTVTDSNGCANTFCDSSFHALRTTNTMVYINVFNPLTTKDQNPTNLSVNIYPNPFTSQTTISFGEEQRNTTIKISDLLSKKIKIIDYTGKQLTIEKGEMSNGIYFVQITDDKKNVVNKKIIIQ